MKDNAVWRESVEVFFNEGHGYPAYFYLLVVLAPVEFLSLYLPSLDAQTWSGSASLFRVSSATALLVLPYFSLRVANQEFAPWRFKPLKHWIREHGMAPSAVGRGQLAFLSLHVGLSVLVCAPLLIWAGAIARTPVAKIAATFALLIFYTFSCGVWGLAALVLWERRAEARQVFIRCFFFVLALLSALIYLPLNPVGFLLAFLGEQPMAPLRIAGGPWPAIQVHMGFHLWLAGAGLAAHRWALGKEGRRGRPD
jgi:hypothetical protein